MSLSDDIVTRLREGLWRNDCCSSPSCNGDWYTPLDDKDFIEAADEIERLRAERNQLWDLINMIDRAIHYKEPINPWRMDRLCEQQMKQWPTVWKAIQKACIDYLKVVRRG